MDKPIQDFNTEVSAALGTELPTEEPTSEPEVKEPTEPKEEPEDEPVEEPNEPDEEPVEEEYETILHNKKEIKIPISEKQTYLQKGYNYDKIHDKKIELEKTISNFNEQINNLGFDGIKDISALLDTLKQNRIEEIKQEYRDKGYEETDIQKLVDADERVQEISKENDQQKETENIQKVEQTLNEEIKEMATQFKLEISTYKDLDNLENGDQIKKHMSNGLTASEAYFIVNKEAIISQEKEAVRKSTIADIAERKEKKVDKGNSREEETFLSDFDKELMNVLGTSKDYLKDFKKKKRR